MRGAGEEVGEAALPAGIDRRRSYLQNEANFNRW
jgi:hypothetical protein